MIKTAVFFYSFLFILGLISFIFLGKRNIFDTIQKEIIFRISYSLIILSTVTALYLTKGRTIFLVAVPLLVYIAFHFRNKSSYKELIFNKIDLLIVGFASLIAYFFSYYYISGEAISGLKIVNLDQSFYAALSDIMFYSKSESFNYLSDPLNPSDKIIPYHYFENWLGILVSNIFKINSISSLYGIIFPTSLFMSILGIISISDSKSHNISWRIFLVVFSSLFLFVTGVYFNQHINSIFYEGNFKFIYVLPYFILMIVLINDYEFFNNLVFVVLLFIPVINIVYLPHIALLSVCLFLYKFYKTKSANFIFENKYFVLAIVFYLILFSYYLFYLSQASENQAGQIVTSIGGIFNNVKTDIISFVNSKFIILIIIGVLFYQKKVDNSFKQLFYFSILFLLFASLLGAILNTNQNSYQIFLSADIIVTFITLLVVIKSSQMMSSYVKYAILIMIFFYSLFCFRRDYLENGKITLFEDSNNYKTSYLNKLSQLRFNNKFGIKIVDANQRIFTRRSPIYCGASSYMPYLDNILYSIVVNPSTLLAPNDNQMINRNRNIEFINGSIFLKKNMKEGFKLDTIQYQKDIVNFIRKFKPEFCIVEGKAEIPNYIIPFLDTAKIDGLNERLFILKKY